MAPSEQTERSKARVKKTLVPMNNFAYDLLLWIMSVLVDLFFREVHPRSSWRIPRKGPVIFVAAPHANQVSTCRCGRRDL
jgi:glycerol-3-phosphate O-acyltransferase/dihydroxyacetone phosphate acyltransferase